MNKIKIASFMFVFFAFVGCGGGGESSSASSTSETVVPKIETKKTVDNTNEIKMPLLKGVESTPTDSL